MRPTKLTALGAIAVLLATIAWLVNANKNLQQQLELTMGFQNQLQQLSVRNAQQRLQFEQQINDLNRQLASSAIQLSNLSNSLQETRLQVDPDYEALLQQARDEAASQYRALSAGSGRTAFSAFSDPDNALAMANQRMPRVYDSYLNALGIAGTERQQIMKAMLDFGAQRYQLLSKLLAGSLPQDQATLLFGADALVQGMSMALSSEQQEQLRQYDLLLRQDTLREVYQQAMRRAGSAIEGLAEDQIMQTLLDEVLSAQNNWGALVAEDGSMRSAYNDKVAAFDRAREQLLPDLDNAQLNQLDRFIETQISGVDVILEASADNNGRVTLTQARIAAEDLPQ
ncbi:MAG: hypothetical protein WDZ52_10765 [Pseudohongiellaceae bacterium]